MTKNELIKRLQDIEGDPIVLINDVELGCITLKSVKYEKFHQSKDCMDEFVTDKDYESEKGYNIFYFENYKSSIDNCILLSINNF